jgi:hypothetical protein
MGGATHMRSQRLEVKQMQANVTQIKGRSARRQVFAAAALSGALLLGGCGPSQSATSGVFEQLKLNIAKAESDLQDEEALEQATRILNASTEPSAHVWAHGKILQKAAALGKRDLFAPHIEALDGKLAEFIRATPLEQIQKDPALRDAYQQADAGLHDAHAALFKEWKGGLRDDATTALLDRAGSLFQARFPDSLFLSEVLFFEAERIELLGRAFEAALLYEEMKRKDFQGKHDKTATERINAIWEKAVVINPPHQGKLPPARELTEPFLGWLSDAQAKAASAADNKQRRTYKARVAAIQLAFSLTADAFATLESIGRDSLDAGGVEALITRVKLSINYEGPAAFATWRAALAPAGWPELWRSEPWRRFMLEVAALKLPLGGPHVEEVYALFTDLISSHDDEVSVDAAIALLTHAGDNIKPLEFRKLRKPLQASEYLWSSGRFRSFLYEIKKRVEGD